MDQSNSVNSPAVPAQLSDKTLKLWACFLALFLLPMFCGECFGAQTLSGIVTAQSCQAELLATRGSREDVFSQRLKLKFKSIRRDQYSFTLKSELEYLTKLPSFSATRIYSEATFKAVHTVSGAFEDIGDWLPSLNDVEEVLTSLHQLYLEQKISDIHFMGIVTSILKNNFELWADLVNSNLLIAVLEDYAALVLKNKTHGGADQIIKNSHILFRIFDSQHPLFAKLSQFVFNSRRALRLASGFESLPPVWKKKFEEKWLTLDEIEPIKAANLKLWSASDSERSIQRCGPCDVLSRGHWSSILERAKGNVFAATLIFVDGNFIGSIKSSEFGDPSFLSLANVEDSTTGRIILNAGLVYHPPVLLLDKISKSHWGYYNYTGKKPLIFKPLLSIDKISTDRKVFSGVKFKRALLNFRKLLETEIDKTRIRPKKAS